LALEASRSGTQDALAPRLTTLKFGKTDITRLIIGSNPFSATRAFMAFRNRIGDDFPAVQQIDVRETAA
jgi:hypothetical protein